jgi:hypothetical protein
MTELKMHYLLALLLRKLVIPCSMADLLLGHGKLPLF